MEMYEAALGVAQRKGLPDDFIQSATELLAQLNGASNGIPGAIQAMRDVDRDLMAVTAFIEKWGRYRDVELLQVVAKGLQPALQTFQNLVHSLTTGERRDIEDQATLGAAVQAIRR
jgi:hypothetical protein